MTSLRLRLLLLHSALSASSMAAECGDDAAAIAPISPIDPPLLLRAARGEAVERTPVWMMRQAGRHMQVYRDLIKEYPTFRDRSETPEVSFEVSMQPYRAYKTDGVILFSDILTPLPAMGVDFSISEKGGIQITPIRTREGFGVMTAKPFQPELTVPFVGSVLKMLRDELKGTGATLLGFVGLPFTLGSYLVEGATGTTSGFAAFRALRAEDPELVKDMLQLLAERIAQYAIYQIDSGAQIIQVFDSWAGHLSPDEFAEWAMPYQRHVVHAIQTQRPHVPVIIYMAPDTFSQGGNFLEQLAESGASMISIDHTVSLSDARARLDAAGHASVGLQGNLDPHLLSTGSKEEIVAATKGILDEMKGKHHVMNLGHGIEATTPEPSAALFVKTVQSYSSALRAPAGRILSHTSDGCGHPFENAKESECKPWAPVFRRADSGLEERTCHARG